MRTQKRVNPISLVTAVVADAKKGKQRRENDEQAKAYAYRSGIHSALLKARILLDDSKIQHFFASMSTLTEFENNRFSRQPIGFSYQSFLIEPKARSLRSEVTWLSYRIAYYSNDITQYLERRSKIEDLIIGSDSPNALQSLTRLDEDLGVSLWSSTLQVALLEDLAGTEIQKDLAAHLKKTVKKGMLPYLLNFTAQRAEKNVSIGWYLENTKRRLGRLKKSDIMTYVRYKTLLTLPDQPRELAAILRIEQNHHEIDIYETYISVLQKITAQRDLRRDLINILRSALERIAHIPDFRITKLLLHLGSSPNVDHGNQRSSSLLLAGKAKASYRLSCRALAEDKQSLSELITASISMSICRPLKSKPPRRAPTTLLPELISGLSQILVHANLAEMTEQSDRADTTEKFAHVFGGLGFGFGLLHFIRGIRSKNLETFLSQHQLTALNMPTLDPLDLIGACRDAELSKAMSSGFDESAARDFANLFSNPSGPTEHLNSEAIALARCYAYSGARRFDDIELQVQSALSSSSRAISSQAAMVAMDAFSINGSITELSALITRECADFGRLPSSLPIEPTFKDVEWSLLDPFASDVSLSIALSVYADSTGDELAQSHRNFALQKLLDANGVNRPSELAAHETKFNRSHFIYLLGKACETSLIDMLPSIESSRKVLEERRDLLILLLQIDAPDRDAYQEELLAISRELTVTRGLQTIDGSRVHVDTAALKTMCKRDLSESFHRYVSLIRSGIGTSDTFDAVLREFIKKDISEKYLLSMPESEADEILIAMINQARDRFLFNIPHGLDSYLSKRIRHGSIVGYLRAPVEKEGLITQQRSDGSYKPNHRWNSAFSQSQNRSELDRAFLSFSRSFDHLLLRLKDVLLHVKSPEQPLGIFDTVISIPSYHLIRSVANRDRSLDSFVETLISSLAALLNPALGNARLLLERETSRQVAELFDALRRSTAIGMTGAASRVELDAAIGRASAATQAAITSVAAWFTPVTPDDCTFSMDDVCHITLEAVKRIYIEFDPSLKITDSTELEIQAENFPALSDILFIAFGNIARWSNLKEPDITVSTALDVDRGVLSLRIVNNVSLREPISVYQEKLASRRIELSDPQRLEMARKEDGSGMFKLASTVYQSELGKLDFGFSAPDEFFLSVDLSAPRVEVTVDENVDR